MPRFKDREEVSPQRDPTISRIITTWIATPLSDVTWLESNPQYPRTTYHVSWHEFAKLKLLEVTRIVKHLKTEETKKCSSNLIANYEETSSNDIYFLFSFCYVVPGIIKRNNLSVLFFSSTIILSYNFRRFLYNFYSCCFFSFFFFLFQVTQSFQTMFAIFPSS